jgi:serine/threonine-protein kinase
MTAEFHQRVREVFDRALERPESDRARFVRSECLGEPALFEAVDRLLQARTASADSFMNTGSAAIQRIGRYMVHGELGRGGMGVVYDAMDPMIERSVALKVINLAVADTDAETLRDRLFKEARSCGRLSHPGIVVIFDVGQEGQSAFIAMELVDGPSLHKMLVSGPRLRTKEALRILKEAASALDYAHHHGVVHRDIKPGNIMLRSDGAVKIADFGIAKVISGEGTTMTGVIMGTPSYMSPEQIEGRSVDGRSDQFSLAVLAYELLAGERPFRADSLPTIAHLIVYGARPSPRTMNADLPPAVDAVFQKALARLAEDRFESCSAFVAALQSAVETVVPVPVAAPVPQPVSVPAQPAPVPVEIVQKRRAEKKSSGAPTIFAGLAAVLLVAFAVFYYLHNKASLSAVLTPGAAAPAAVPSPVQPNTTGAPKNIPVAPAVPAGPPVIKQFHIDESIKTGQPATLTWDVVGADKVTIDQGIGKNLAPKGMSVVVPAVTTTYTLTASSAAGTEKKTAKVEVESEEVPVAVRVKMLHDDAETQRKQGHLGEAIRLMTVAASLGDTAAMVQLGDDYASDDNGVPEDDHTAMAWYRRAAERGNTDGMVALGGMYEIGIEGVDADEAEAAKWFQKAADLNNAAAMYDLGTLYEKGSGVPKSLAKAKELYEKSAALGNTEAKRKLALKQPHK